MSQNLAGMSWYTGGQPSWTSYGPSPNNNNINANGYKAPPPPNAPGDSINAAGLLPSQTVLEVVIALFGPNL